MWQIHEAWEHMLFSFTSTWHKIVKPGVPFWLAMQLPIFIKCTPDKMYQIAPTASVTSSQSRQEGGEKNIFTINIYLTNGLVLLQCHILFWFCTSFLLFFLESLWAVLHWTVVPPAQVPAKPHRASSCSGSYFS